MEITLKDIRLARKRAYDRVDYWLQKNAKITIKQSGLRIPTVPKDLKPDEYEDWYNYYYNLRGNDLTSNIGEQVTKGWRTPDRDIGPTPVDPLKILYERLDRINPQACEITKDKIATLMNMVHLHVHSTATPESIVADAIKEHWDIWKDVEEAADYMLKNYYGGLTKLERALSELYSIFGFHYISNNPDIRRHQSSDVSDLHRVADSDIIVNSEGEIMEGPEVEVVIPLYKMSRAMRDELNNE